MNIAYGICVGEFTCQANSHWLEILHFVGFENPPIKEDYTSLKEELRKDGIDKEKDRLIYFPAPPELLEFYKRIAEQLS